MLALQPRRAPPAPPRTVALEEESAWVALYHLVADPAIAEEVIDQLDADPELRRGHPALYLLCRESRRRHKARLTRRRRIRGWLRRLLEAIRGSRSGPAARRRASHRARATVPTMAGEPQRHEPIPARPNAKAA